MLLRRANHAHLLMHEFPLIFTAHYNRLLQQLRFVELSLIKAHLLFQQRQSLRNRTKEQLAIIKRDKSVGIRTHNQLCYVGVA